ncbi:MAG: sulfatase [Verrucomicrobiales bacterium]
MQTPLSTLSAWIAIFMVPVIDASLRVYAAQETGQKPHVILILADDLGWSDLACYGSDLHETPHLDALAEDGFRFTQAYAASPVCSPTRASLLTGRHPARLDMTIWRESAKNRGNRSLLEPITRDALPLSEKTLAEYLKQAGYYTAHVGKWHLGPAESYPQPHGFDVNIGGTLWGAPQSFFYPYSGTRYFQGWRYVPDLEPGEPGDYLTDKLTEKAMEVLDQKADHQPVFLNLWYHSVHTPIDGRPEKVEKYRRKIRQAQPSRHRNADYAAMVESLDENVGRLLKYMESRGWRENALILFLSDNGGFVNECKLHPGVPVTSNAPLRSGKGSCYEGGVRIPWIMDLPGSSLRQKVLEAPVTTCDLMPTVLSILGITHDEDTLLDGQNLSTLWQDVVVPGDLGREALFFHYPHYYPTTTPVSAMRHGPWKYLYYFEDEREELYYLPADEGEHHNLMATRPEVMQRMRSQLRSWWEEVDAPMPEKRPERP